MSTDYTKKHMVKKHQEKILQYFQDEKWKNEQEYQDIQKNKNKIINAIDKLFPEIQQKIKQQINHTNEHNRLNKVQNDNQLYKELHQNHESLQDEQSKSFGRKKQDSNDELVQQISALEKSIKKIAKYITYRDSSNLGKMKKIQNDIQNIQKQKKTQDEQDEQNEQNEQKHTKEDIVRLIADKISGKDKQKNQLYQDKLYQDIGELKNKIENNERNIENDYEHKQYNKKYDPIKEYQRRPNQQQNIENRNIHKQHFEQLENEQNNNQKNNIGNTQYPHNRVLLQIEKQTQQIQKSIQNIQSEQSQFSHSNWKNNLERKLHNIALEINNWKQGLDQISEIKGQIAYAVENIQKVQKFLSKRQNVPNDNINNPDKNQNEIKEQISELKDELTFTEQRNSKILGNMQKAIERVVEKLNQNHPQNPGHNPKQNQIQNPKQNQMQSRPQNQMQNPGQNQMQSRPQNQMQNPGQNLNQNNNQLNTGGQVNSNLNNKNNPYPQMPNSINSNTLNPNRNNYNPNQQINPQNQFPNQQINPNNPAQQQYGNQQYNTSHPQNNRQDSQGTNNTMRNNEATHNNRNTNSNTRRHINQMNDLRMQVKKEEQTENYNNNEENKTISKNIGRAITPLAVLIVFATSGYAFYDYLATQWNTNEQNNNTIIVTGSTAPTKQINDDIISNIQLDSQNSSSIEAQTVVINKNEEKQIGIPSFSTNKITQKKIPPKELPPKENKQLKWHYQQANKILSETGPTQKAIAHLEKAAKGDLSVAQYKLALIYENGQGVTENKDYAKTLYKKAAEKGNIYAMHNLGVIIAEQQENDPDKLQQAIYWFEKAAQLGFTDSQFNLAVLHEKGVGEPVNKVQAYKWYAIAAANGDQEAADKRDELANQLSGEQLTKASKIIAQYQPAEYNQKANEKEFSPEKNLVNGEYTRKAKPSQLVKQIQSYLKRLGYQIGKIDGITGPKTINAVRKFQRQYGVVADGSVNGELLKTLISAAEPEINNNS